VGIALCAGLVVFEYAAMGSSAAGMVDDITVLFFVGFAIATCIVVGAVTFRGNKELKSLDSDLKASLGSLQTELGQGDGYSSPRDQKDFRSGSGDPNLSITQPPLITVTKKDSHDSTPTLGRGGEDTAAV